MIQISLNNETKKINAQTHLNDAIVLWGYGEKKIAIAINGEFVPRSTYAAREILAGDKIDIVMPIGGG
jgi:sulfur carrier protein